MLPKSPHLASRRHAANTRVADGSPHATGSAGALPPVPPDRPAELLTKIGAGLLSKCERRWPKRRHELGPCLVWTGPRGPDAERGPYGRTYDAAIGKTDYMHRIVWRRCFGPIPKGKDVDDVCNVGLCERPD